MVKIGYIVSRFPTLSETFVLYEALEMKRRGLELTLFPLVREALESAHPETAEVEPHVVYTPFVSPRILVANWRIFREGPLRYLDTLLATFRGVVPSVKFTVGAAGIWLKAVYLAAEARRRGIEHIHAHFCTHPALAAWVIRRLVGIPYSFTAHGSDLHVDQTMLARKLREAQFAVMISRYNLEFAVDAVGEGLRAKMRLIHCGSDTATILPGPRVEGPPFRILCVASLRPVKGHEALLRACRLLTDRGIDWQLVLVGDGVLRRPLEGLSERLVIADRVRFLGQQSRPVVLSELRACQAVALTSVMDRQGRREGIPVSLMEALAVERPVVASRLSGIPELIEHGVTGLLAEPGNPSDIAKQLEWIARNPEAAQELARRGRERVRTSFDLRTNAGRLMEAIRHGGQGARGRRAPQR